MSLTPLVVDYHGHMKRHSAVVRTVTDKWATTRRAWAPKGPQVVLDKSNPRRVVACATPVGSLTLIGSMLLHPDAWRPDLQKPCVHKSGGGASGMA